MGRPTLPVSELKRMCQVFLTEHQARWVRQLGEGNLSAGVRECIMRAIAAEQRQHRPVAAPGQARAPETDDNTSW